MIAAAALDTLPRGMNGELRQLLFFMSGRESAAGLGAATVSVCPAPAARNGGVRPLYLVDPQQKHRRFYLAQGCRLADKPDPALFALEPEDIHLVCDRL